MSDAADSTEAVTNESVEQVKGEAGAAASNIDAAEASDVKTEQNGGIESDKVDNEMKLDAKTAEDDKADIKQKGSADDKHMADADNDDDDDDTTSKAERDHKRKRAHDADNADYPKRKKHGYTKNRNIKSTFDMDESNDHGEIRRQVEFYFSDSNLPIDKYLLQLTGGHENRPVDLRTIHNFKRMTHFQPYSEVANAVRSSIYLELNDDDQITRKTPLDPKFGSDIDENKKLLHSDNMAHSIYAKGFGEEQSSTHRDIEAFFDPYGPIKSIRLRRTERDEFKGSVFVEFATQELQEKFLNLEVKPQWEINKDEMVDLQIMSKGAYVQDKHQGILDGLTKPKAPRPSSFNGGRGRNFGRGGRNDGGKDRGAKHGGDRRRSDYHRGNGNRKNRYDDKPRDRDNRKRRYDDESRSRSRSVSRSRSRSPDRSNRKYKRSRFDGDDDDWRERREHDQKEDRKEAKAVEAGAEQDE